MLGGVKSEEVDVTSGVTQEIVLSLHIHTIRQHEKDSIGSSLFGCQHFRKGGLESPLSHHSAVSKSNRTLGVLQRYLKGCATQAKSAALVCPQ